MQRMRSDEGRYLTVERKLYRYIGTVAVSFLCWMDKIRIGKHCKVDLKVSEFFFKKCKLQRVCFFLLEKLT